MITCPGCSKPLSDNETSCPSCGASLLDSLSPTRRLETPRPDTPKSGSYDATTLNSQSDPGQQGNRQKQTPQSRAKQRSRSSLDSIDDARFVAGAILVDRYRIVGLLGKGGMGEVYRADDLKLGQPVALKFLPDHLLSDGAALARFHREVRVARQVSHKNVCRVYDIGEVDGHHFLSMEYIKGEELSSLLRRIGRLPIDKGLQLARQICAGLAAAHDAGVLHRDLKPSNIMIDGDGNARILDFGLAGLADEFADDELTAGTPAYMAPEQLDGKECTVRSDVYSLGLLLYELFTAKRAFAANTLGELIKLRRSDATPTTPTSIIPDLDPLIERVIARCLQRNPEQRPSSALQVAAALPGGDPIAAALAAGETPSPEMVAAAPTAGALKPAVAAGLLVLFIGGMALACWLTKYTAIYRQTPLEQSPEVLSARARDVIKKFGYSYAPLDTAEGMVLRNEYLEYIKEHDQSAQRWSRLRTDGPGAYRFWYRQSPRYFDTLDVITVDRPALDVSDMVSVYLDMSGRLHWFIAVPPQREPVDSTTSTPDWSLPFREAGLDISSFKSVDSSSVPLHAYDVRAAWDGADPAHPDVKTHVEAAAFRGRLTYFETIYPWDQATRQEETARTLGERLLVVLLIGLYMVALVGSAILARRNLRTGKGDRRGAIRLAIVYGSLRMAIWLLAEHHNGLVYREFLLFLDNLSKAVFTGAFLAILYLALEPLLRRRWPHRIISWSRVLAGDFRNPLVGRDFLIGATFGVGMIWCSLLTDAVPRWIGLPPEISANPGGELMGAHLFMSRFFSQMTATLFLTFIAMLLLWLFVILLRRERLAFVALWILLTIVQGLLSEAGLLMMPFVGLVSLVVLVVLYRFGLFALMASLFIVHLWVFMPMTTELTAWYAFDFTVGLAIAVALVLYAAYISLAGQPLLSGKLLPDDW
jgi:Protein kinase domain